MVEGSKWSFTRLEKPTLEESWSRGQRRLETFSRLGKLMISIDGPIIKIWWTWIIEDSSISGWNNFRMRIQNSNWRSPKLLFEKCLRFSGSDIRPKKLNFLLSFYCKPLTQWERTTIRCDQLNQALWLKEGAFCWPPSLTQISSQCQWLEVKIRKMLKKDRRRFFQNEKRGS